MKALSQVDIVFVVGTSTFAIQQGEDSSDRYMKVTITRDDRLQWTYRQAENGWLLVCETSVRLIIGQEEGSRIEFGDVIERAHWSEGQLYVEDTGGKATSMRVTDGRLTL